MCDSEEISFSDIVPREYEVENGNDEENEEIAPNYDVDLNADESNDEEEAEQEDDGNENVIEVAEVQQSSSKKTRRFKSEVKKCASKWILFSNEVRPLVMAEFPEYGFSEVAKTVAERYRNISAHDSERLDEIVSADRERYKRELAEAEEDIPVSSSVAMDDLGMSSTTLAFPLVINTLTLFSVIENNVVPVANPAFCCISLLCFHFGALRLYVTAVQGAQGMQARSRSEGHQPRRRAADHQGRGALRGFPRPQMRPHRLPSRCTQHQGSRRRPNNLHARATGVPAR